MPARAPLPDSPLSGIARDVLTAAAAILAAAAPLTHLAQVTGVSFGTYAVLVAIAAVVVVAATLWFRRSRGVAGEAVVRRGVVGLLALCSLAALLAILVQHATVDDAIYLGNVVHSLAHPADAMSFEITYAWFGDQPIHSPHWNASTAFDYLAGVVAYMTGIPLLTVRYLVLPPLTAALLPLTFFYLLTRLGFRDATALAGCLLFGVVLLLMRETEQAPGAVALLRICQGKFVAHVIGAPLFAAFTLDLVRAPTRGRWTRLFVVATAIAGCGASSVVLFGPLVFVLFVAAAVAYAPTIRAALRVARLMGAAIGYPIVIAIWAYATAREPFDSESAIHVIYSRDFGPNAAWVFPGPLTIAFMLAAVVLALPAIARRERLFVVVWAIAAGVCFLNPFASSVVIEHITTQSLYWRLFYVAPILPLLALAGGGVAMRVERLGARRGAWALALAVGTLVLLQVPAHLTGLYRRTQLVHPFPDPDRCLNRIAASQARYLARIAPPGPMLAPPYLALMVPLVAADHPQLWHQEESMRHWAREDADLRYAASSFLVGKRPDGAESVSELLARYPEVVAVAAFPDALVDTGLDEVLDAARFTRAAERRPDVMLFVRER